RHSASMASTSHFLVAVSVGLVPMVILMCRRLAPDVDVALQPKACATSIGIDCPSVIPDSTTPPGTGGGGSGGPSCVQSGRVLRSVSHAALWLSPVNVCRTWSTVSLPVCRSPLTYCRSATSGKSQWPLGFQTLLGC